MEDKARYAEEDSTARRADILHVNYKNTATDAPKMLHQGILTIDQMRQYRIIPLAADRSNIEFGITTTTSQQTMNAIIEHFSDQRISFSLISETGYREYMLLYDPPKKVEYQDIKIESDRPDNLVRSVSVLLDQVRADDMLAYLVSQGHHLNASDIHLEAMPNSARIRFRIDGVLHPVAELQPDKYRMLISAIASAGNVSTSADYAQQGHIAQKVTMADGNVVDVNVRLETIPAVHGIEVVMRLFNMDRDRYSLDKLGLADDQRAVVDDIIRRPSGLVLIVGPTGSGKTTTLYSMLNSLASDERKIITVEDPVEYQFDGITQIPVKLDAKGENNSFADKLRAILRLDPDIIMVGEVRDSDTARTALQASLTGHLVMATFHASSAAAALTRLSDVIGTNPLFVSAIRLVMAQRLIRQLDDDTKQVYDPTDEELETIRKVIHSLPEGADRPNIAGLRLYKPGTSPENPYGFRGQIAIREQFVMTGDIRRLLEANDHVLSAQEIEEAAVKSGMRTMLQDAILQVVAGKTTLEEVFRAVG